MKPTENRNLYNADCNTWAYKYHPKSAFYRNPDEPPSAELIHRYVGILADNGVDTLVMNPNAQYAWYPSKTVPTCLDGYRRGDRSFFYGHIMGWEMTTEQIENWLDETVYFMDLYLDWAEAGMDWYAETAAACRQRGISPWASIRMNDMHGATKYMQGSFMNSELFKNPAMRLRGTTFNRKAPLQNSWMGLNFEKQEVRDFTLAIIRDSVENYDYEGLELDWTRWALCCEPDPPQATIDMITEWHAEIRRMTERQAEKNGKPFPLGIRHYGTFDQLRGIGIDIPAMAKAGLLDFIAPTNGWQTSWDIPLDQMREELGPDVAIYGVVEDAPNWLMGYLPNQTKGNFGTPQALDYRLTSSSAPMLRGNAAAKLVLGADGIETFNFFCTDSGGHWPWMDEDCHADYPALQRLEDLEFLRGKPKFYTFASRNGFYVHDILESSGPFPAILAPAQRQECRLPMCAEPVNEHQEFIIQVVVDKKDELPPIGVYFNGCWPNFDGVEDELLLFPSGTMVHHAPEHVGLNFTFPLSAIREGWNDIGIMHGTPWQWNTDQSACYVNIISLEFAIREKQ